MNGHPTLCLPSPLPCSLEQFRRKKERLEQRVQTIRRREQFRNMTMGQLAKRIHLERNGGMGPAQHQELPVAVLRQAVEKLQNQQRVQRVCLNENQDLASRQHQQHQRIQIQQRNPVPTPRPHPPQPQPPTSTSVSASQPQQPLFVLPEDSKFICTECQKDERSAFQLCEHMAIYHSPPDKRIWRCVYCNTKFGRRGGLRRHVQMVHMQMMHKCPVPGCTHPGYKCTKALTAHMKTHESNETSAEMTDPSHQKQSGPNSEYI